MLKKIYHWLRRTSLRDQVGNLQLDVRALSDQVAALSNQVAALSSGIEARANEPVRTVETVPSQQLEIIDTLGRASITRLDILMRYMEDNKVYLDRLERAVIKAIEEETNTLDLYIAYHAQKKTEKQLRPSAGRSEAADQIS